MDKIRLIVNIIIFPSTLWAAIQFYLGPAKVVSDLEFHRSFFLYMILLGISLLIFINLKWVNGVVQRRKENKEKTSPEGQLKTLTNDVYNLSYMMLELGKSFEGELEIQDVDTADLMLAKHVIERLNSICEMKLPPIFDYPTYFSAIATFVKRGNVSEVKKISRRFFR